MYWLAACQHAIQWGHNLSSGLLQAKNIGYLLLLALMTTLVFGLTLFLIDPAIESPLDGIWTMTHVGFGDVVPVSFLGRILASILILIGLVFFSLFTALISVTLIDRNINALGVDMQQTEGVTNQSQSGNERIFQELSRLHERMKVFVQSTSKKS